MRYFFLLVLLTVGLACKPKILSGEKLENKLIETMQEHLDKNAKPGVSYKVEDVAFYPEKKEKRYRCDFHVQMHHDKVDTTGVMSAIIPNDFSKVERTQ
jgi:hypothetical protein